MKMKQVMAETGLSARTVRYYEEEGLFVPQTTVVNGRRIRAYTQQDVVCLRMIASLRRAGFSIGELRQMLEDPDAVRAVFPAYLDRLRAQRAQLETLIRCAEGVDPEALTDAFQLAELLKAPAQTLPLPRRDVTPHFARYDPVLPEPQPPGTLERVRDSSRLASVSGGGQSARNALPLSASEMRLRSAATLAEELGGDRDAPVNWAARRPEKPWRVWLRRVTWSLILLALAGFTVYVILSRR